MIAWRKGVFTAFPDYSQQIHDVYLDGDVVVAEATGRRTHTGPFVLAKDRVLDATGRSFKSSYLKVLRFENGLLVGDRHYQDLGALLAQLTGR